MALDLIELGTIRIDRSILDYEPDIRPVDGQRLTVIMLTITGTSVLDVGAGNGTLIKAMGKIRGTSAGLLAVDIKEREGVDKADVCALPFPDHSFDTVLALELIEHLNDPARALAELRRVTGRQLIVTVPFAEMPVPNYHKQRFDMARITEMMPKGKKTLLFKERPGTHWLMVEEGV